MVDLSSVESSKSDNNERKSWGKWYKYRYSEKFSNSKFVT